MTDTLLNPSEPLNPSAALNPARILPDVLRLGTRRSLLARTQSQGVAERIAASTGSRVELVDITTEGDTSTEQLSVIGGTGVFATALRQALIRGEIDLAVHSLKDLPTAAHPGLTLAAIPQRADYRDALVARDNLTLAELPAGSRIGTGSPRRAAQLRALGLDLHPVPVRGNVDTRLAFVRTGNVDAVLLARAGLVRLGRAAEITEILDDLTMLPAPGQGALAVECRSADEALQQALAAHLDDADTRAATCAERSVLAAIEAGCLAPLGALGEVVTSLNSAGQEVVELSLRAVVVSADGSQQLRRSAVGPVEDPIGLGQQLAAQLLADGAADLLVGTQSSSARGQPQSAAALEPDLSIPQSAPERAL